MQQQVKGLRLQRKHLMKQNSKTDQTPVTLLRTIFRTFSLDENTISDIVVLLICLKCVIYRPYMLSMVTRHSLLRRRKYRKGKKKDGELRNR